MNGRYFIDISGCRIYLAELNWFEKESDNSKQCDVKCNLLIIKMAEPVLATMAHVLSSV